jgi:hypothetical protein
MDAHEAYDYLHAQFVHLAEEHRIPIAPQFGRRANMVTFGTAPYFEVIGDRFFSIADERGALEAQWDGQRDPAHLKVFANLDACPIDILWHLRCAWFDFEVSLDEAEKAVLQVASVASMLKS